MPGASDALAAEVAQRQQQLIETRRYFHQRPELSFAEHETAAEIARRLRELGLDPLEGVGGAGVTAMLRGKAEGRQPARTLLVRADIDALPVEEEADESVRPWRSQNPGVMHACGHDGHIAIALTLAMLTDGVTAHPKVDATLGLHLWTPVRVGQVSVAPGAVFSSADEVWLRVRGRGSHGAMPHLGVDPVVVAAEIITALQTLVAREVSPFHPAVVTFGSIHGGNAFNVIADSVELRGTLRAYDPDDRELLRARIGEVAHGVARGMRAEVEYEVRGGCPACVNDPAMAEIVRRAAIDTVGAENVPGGDQRQAASDDMAYFLEAAPGCYFFVGASDPERGIDAPHHSARFDIAEEALSIGLETLARATLEYLKP